MVENAAPAVDFGDLFEGLPTAYLVMGLDLVIVEVNRAYCELLGRTRADLLGRYVFDAFPPTADAVDDQGRNTLQTSFERARDSGQPDALPLYSYGVADQATGLVVDRHWSLVSAPLLDATGRTVLVLQRVEDVSDYVRVTRAGAREQQDRQESWRSRVAQVEAELYTRVRELQAARAAEERAAATVAALAEVTLQLTQVSTVDELTEVVVHRGLAVLGAESGAVAVREGAAVRVSTSALGSRAASEVTEVTADDPMPTPAAATTGRRTLLRDLEACRAHSSEVLEAAEVTGCPAWAFLPLADGDAPRGSLSVGYASAQTFDPRSVEVLEAFAAQCAHALGRIQRQQAAAARTARALALSEALQRSLLTEPVQPAHLQLAVRYRPATAEAQIGGDWYDAFTSAGGVTSLVVGDVSGHDREAAAVMGQVRNLLRGIAHVLVEPPAAVLSQLDRALADQGAPSLATAVLAVVESPGEDEDGRPRPCRLRWSNAGHPPPLLVSPDGSVRLLETEPDLLLGLDATTARHDHRVALAPGSTVLLFTDGLVERRGSGLDEGLAWLVSAVAPMVHLDPDGLCDALLELVAGHAEDDVVLLAARTRP